MANNKVKTGLTGSMYVQNYLNDLSSVLVTKNQPKVEKIEKNNFRRFVQMRMLSVAGNDI